MAEPMNIWKLKEYAQYNDGFNSGHFICINSDLGIFELKWLDAFFGFVKFIQPEIEGYVTTQQLREIFGDEQLYIPTTGYKKLRTTNE